MGFKPTTIRLPNRQHQFRSQDAQFSEKVRACIDDLMIRECVGLCACCGQLIFLEGDFATLGGGTPAGDVFNWKNSNCSFDLCEDHYKRLMAAMMNGTDVPPEKEYVRECGSEAWYSAETSAIADAQPGREWGELVTARDELDGTKKKRLIGYWVESPDRKRSVFAEVKQEFGVVG